MFSRRTFLAGTLAGTLAWHREVRAFVTGDRPQRQEARHYRKLDDGLGTVQCALCPRRCTLGPGTSGFCRARRNEAGTLYALGYALPCSVHVDPIEKKPFYQFHPKSTSFSLACAGCNLRCKFCQNWEISQRAPTETRNTFLPPGQVPPLAALKGSKSVAFTYTEATTFFEYMLDTAKANQKAGILSVCHSNGYINAEPHNQLIPYLDAANIDLKGFSERFYAEVCEATLEPVLASLKRLRAGGVWVEITNLVIPGYNDSPEMLGSLARWVADNLGADTPLHFSRFFPLYKMTAVPPTPVETLERARTLALKAGLRYVYIGNVPGHPANNTWCPRCGGEIIRRAGFSVLAMNFKGSACAACGTKIAGVGLAPA